MRKPWYNTLGNLVIIFTVLFQVLGPLGASIATAQQTPANSYVPFNGNAPSGYEITPGAVNQGLSDGPFTIGDGNGGAVFDSPDVPLTGAAGADSDTPTVETPAGPLNVGAEATSDPASGPGDTDGRRVETLSNYFAAENEGTVYKILIGAAGFIAGLGGVVFDYTFKLTVNQFSCLFTADQPGCEESEFNGQLGGVVNDLWEVIRDLFNIIFIFSLVYIGLRLILKSDDSATQKSIGMLIAAALLVNFSLYIAKLIIDISNYTAVQIHQSMVGSIQGSYSVASYFDLGTQSIAGAFMEVLRIASWFGGTGGLLDTLNAVVLGIFTFIFLSYLGFIFLYGAFMLIARLIALIILLVFSPMMFLGWVLPQFQSYSKQWMAMFIGYSFYIPAYVFLLYMSLFVMIQLATVTTNTGGFADSLASPSQAARSVTSDGFSIYFMFFMGVGLLYASTKVAGIISKSGAGATMNMAGNFASKLTTGIAAAGAGASSGYLGRNAIGGGVGGALKNWSERQEAKTGKSSIMSRGLRNAGANLEGRKYGGSYSLADKKKAESEGNRRAAGLQNTKGAKDTLANSSSTVTERQRAIAKLDKSEIIEMSKTADGAKLLTENSQYLTADHIKALTEDKEKDAGAVASILASRKAKVSATIGSGPDQKAFKNLTPDELSAFDAQDFIDDPEKAIHLNEDKIKALPMVDAEKNNIRAARKAAFIEVVHKNKSLGGVDKASLLNLDADKLADLPDEVFDVSKAQITDVPNVISFIQDLPLNALAKIQSKKGKGIASKVRTQLENFVSSNPPTPGSKSDKIKDWLKNDNIGKNFG